MQQEKVKLYQELKKDTKILTMQKSGKNSKNRWRFRCNWQGFQNMDQKITNGELLPFMQKACLLRTAKIVRKVLDTYGCVLQLAIQDIPAT